MDSNAITEPVSNVFSAMAFTLIEILGLYMIMPVFVAAIIFRYVFGLKGQSFKFLIGIVGLVCLYFLATKGFPQIGEIMQQKTAI
ncbi:hypothetical protein [Paenibacillus aquistagni]|uniref:hypothetical protein n=1 Tax=Paenibacillus aquistagni TaxID=1852522 RepID=UPI00145A034D|nr:hypothetical protein [Paenibacillus aquistagni]NMM52055.1 hypothetical protein [Paenibacillus aquistagni]